MPNLDDSELRRIVIGRVSPYIYSFQTNTLPNYLKVGDTYRPVEVRLDEWRRYYKDLTEVSRHQASIDDTVFFRDHAVHKYLQQTGVRRLPIDMSNNIYSTEFFEGVGAADITAAVSDIVDSYTKRQSYEYYNNFKQKIAYHFKRTLTFGPRNNQQEVIDNFKAAVAKGRTNLLMYAVMRFGKSMTSIWCAKAMDAKLVVIVSAKADVRSEWKQTVESHKDFVGYRFMEGADISADMDVSQIYGHEFVTGSGETETCSNIVMFFSLQDLAGSSESIKARHRILQTSQPDLLIIDETHFGARAQVLGKILAGVELLEADQTSLKPAEDVENFGSVDKLISINAKIKLHLSGTPYRILMGSEFTQEDIIAFVQFSDIYEAKTQWNADNLDVDEWRNPYYGFPHMIRFAFNPNQSSRKKLAGIPGSKPSELFAPVSTSKTGDYRTFLHEPQVVDLLQVLDGTKDDDELLGILDHESVKAGKLARHIVIVLPYRASCDAFEQLLSTHTAMFKNLADYTLFNISGHDKCIETPEDIKAAIAQAEYDGKRTITLTVNKMLTGSTVPQWDTMIYLKGTSSPQEYDQAVFRIQSPWIERYADESGDTIDYDMKPQTLLVDLDPTRLFYLQELKAFTYGANTHAYGNENIETCIQRELRVSPIIALNAAKNKLVEIQASRIIDEVRKYSNNRSISDDVNEIAIDISLKDNQGIYDVIHQMAELGAKNGLAIRPTDDAGQELDDDEDDSGTDDADGPNFGQPKTGGDRTTTDVVNTDASFEKQFRTYYVMILLFAFLSSTNERSLTDVINHIGANDDNRRIARSLGLKTEDLTLIRQHINWSVLSSLDYKIQNSDFRAEDATITALEHIDIAIHKFGKLSDAEVFTPPSIVNTMYDSLDPAVWNDIQNAKILDIASKSGSFAQGFVKKALQSGATIADIKNSFYSIPTSPAAYEFTRKMYQALGLNTDMIAAHITSYDLIRYPDSHMLTLLHDKKLCDITIADLEAHATIADRESEVGDMKFTAVVGNPPYQLHIPGRGDQPPIYHEFLESAYRLADQVVMIHPARFLFNAGLTPKTWNQKMLTDKHFKVVYYEQNTSKVFPNTNIMGGIVITLRDTNQDFGETGVFTTSVELTSILAKVEARHQSTLDTIISGRGIYRLTEAAHLAHPEVADLQSKGHKNDVGTGAFKALKDVLLFESQPNDGQVYARILGLPRGKREYYWINRQYINNPDNFEKYKVLLPKANGSEAINDNSPTAIIGKPLIAEPLVGFTETFISIGAFDTKSEAEAAFKYVKSKFARVMLGLLKITQDNPRDKWKKVPLQDFTIDSDIDWSGPVTTVDSQLYQKYDLSQAEIAFIESHIKSME